jgi:hypothetical protein
MTPAGALKQILACLEIATRDTTLRTEAEAAAMLACRLVKKHQVQLTLPAAEAARETGHWSPTWNGPNGKQRQQADLDAMRARMDAFLRQQRAREAGGRTVFCLRCRATFPEGTGHACPTTWDKHWTTTTTS